MYIYIKYKLYVSYVKNTIFDTQHNRICDYDMK